MAQSTLIVVAAISTLSCCSAENVYCVAPNTTIMCTVLHQLNSHVWGLLTLAPINIFSGRYKRKLHDKMPTFPTR